MNKSKLKPYNRVIQVCPDCGKVDVYKDDGHDCNDELDKQQRRELDW